MSEQMLWQYLETLPAQSSSLCDWAYALGKWPEFATFQNRYLQLSGGKVMAVECKTDCGLGCARKVVEHGKDDIVAVCPEQEAKPYKLNRQEILDYSLKRNVFHKDLCSALGITHRESKLADCRHTWRLSEYIPEAGSVFPVFITFQQEPDDLTDVVRILCINHECPFTLIAPTRQLLTIQAEHLLEKRNALFLTLSDEMSFSDKGILQTVRPAADIFAQFNKEIPAPDSGGMVHFPTPAGISWEAVTIQFVDGHIISIRAGDKIGHYNYTQMGMASKRNGEPTEQWKLLQGFADARGRIDWKSSIASNNLKKQKQELSKRLRDFFRLEDDSIEWIKEGKNKHYLCKFRILPEGAQAKV